MLDNQADPQSHRTPVVIDLGRQSKKRIKALRKGKPGKLLDKVAHAVESLRQQSAIAKDAQTIVVVVREKRRSLGLLGY